MITHISYPDRDHFLMPSEIYPHMIPFFRKHVNDMEPDLPVLRAAALLRLQGVRPSSAAIDETARTPEAAANR